jgi:hypothetical protein
MKARILQSYIKPREVYEKVYDSITQEKRDEGEILFAGISANPTDNDIIQMRDFLKPDKKEYSDDEIKQAIDQALGLSWVAFDQGITQDREKKRQETINKWLQEAQEKDIKVLAVTPFENINCANCNTVLKYKWSTLYGSLPDDKSDRVLLFYECTNCSKREAFFEDGTRWVSTNTNNCLICSGKRRATITKDSEGKTFVIYECLKCGSKEVEDI